ncbi:MAG: family 43 glycosylhydrolase [Oscillospiraceae bacterium]|nr:family 43 glycosylhydrolase [Oscillospiraceae bacterium]
MPQLQPYAHTYKPETCANPISPNVFCADPTSVEYEGRLYVFGTNDHQQYAAVGDEGKNTYEHIRSLVIFSTNDMRNWEYHGIIDVARIAPWIINAWAPSVISRVEDDGLTHFYLYFSNNGCGVGVLTATHPLGPWGDPLGRPLIYQNMPGLENCPSPFDPGACIDENGTGWLSFGGGSDENGVGVYSKVPKIVKLGKDLLSFDSPFVSITAPYFFEAGELNVIDGRFFYSYSSDWQPRTAWDRADLPAPPMCSMGYMTTQTPLDGESWSFRGGFFLNAGDSGMDWCNNHTHITEYCGRKYILHHTMHIQERMQTKGGFRCMCVDDLPYTAEGFPLAKATRQGVEQLRPLNPFVCHSGAEMCTCAQMGYEEISQGKTAVKSLVSGAWTFLSAVDWNQGAQSISVKVKGKGRIEIRADHMHAEPIVRLTVETEANAWATLTAELPPQLTGIHDLYFVFSEANICLQAWQAKGKDDQ